MQNVFGWWLFRNACNIGETLQFRNRLKHEYNRTYERLQRVVAARHGTVGHTNHASHIVLALHPVMFVRSWRHLVVVRPDRAIIRMAASPSPNPEADQLSINQRYR